MSVRSILYVSLAWATVVGGVLIWQSYTYTGFFAAAAEWQFRTFDRMFPAATIALITGILQLPFLTLIFVRLRRRRRLYGSIGTTGLIARERLGLQIVSVACGAFAIVAFVAFVSGLFANGIGEKPAPRIVVNGPLPESGGFVSTAGVIRLDRIGYYRERSIFASRDLWLAPLTSGLDDTTIRYFVEVDGPGAAADAQTQEVTGILRRAAAPGGLLTLYENQGYSVDRDALVIFDSSKAARWPYTSTMIDFAVLALLCLLSILFLRWHLGRLNPHKT